MEQYSAYIGIDVSKFNFDLSVHGQDLVHHFPMNPDGMTNATDFINNKGSALVVIESTGGYEKELVTRLLKEKVAVAVQNPKRIRDFARAIGVLAKTDKLDAQVIARYAATIKPESIDLDIGIASDLKELAHRRQSLLDMRVAEKNRLGHHVDKAVSASITRAIVWLDREVKRLEKYIIQCVNKVHQLKQKKQLLSSFPGIGELTAVLLLAHLPELGRLNRGEVASLSGLAPFNSDSGITRGKRMIYGGRHTVRRALFMPTLVAIQSNSVIKKHYHHLLTRGKCKMVSITACMRKVIVILNTMIRNNELWKAH